jgi:hypothetical protein
LRIGERLAKFVQPAGGVCRGIVVRHQDYLDSLKKSQEVFH